ncbi:colicin D domain-containing protein [Niabella pedocola]|uniref:colicin D domain-containing protein n=1 Tax=Niabella pedocola TaxID=1752077 RepID=UPI00374DE9BC
MKHGPGFGVFGKWNPAKNAEFNAAIHRHINATGVRMINGIYEEKAVIHYVNPSTGVNVFSSPNRKLH